MFSYIAATLILGVMLLSAWAYKITHDYGTSFVKNNSRGLTAPGESAQRPELVFVARVTGMSGCRWADPTTETFAGAYVPLGRKYALASGLMEITYLSGAKVILEGPCRYKVESDRGGFLALGKLTASVESEKQRPKTQDLRPKTKISKSPNLQIHYPLSTTHYPLFSVRTPTALVTDLGTEFGVEVSANGDTMSCVFRGSVKVQAIGGTSLASATKREETVLRANQSARVESGRDQTPKIIRDHSGKADRNSFVRQLPKWARIKLFNTGVDAIEGAADPHWQFVARSDDPKFAPRPAVVAPNAEDKLPNDPTRSQWISGVGDSSPLPDRVIYTFRTTFDLTGTLPKTASIRGKFLADDRVVAVRLNGHDLHAPKDRKGAPFVYWSAFQVAAGFVDGVNVLEVDVFNEAPPPDGRETADPNPMACRVELEGFVLSAPAAAAYAAPPQAAGKQ